MKTLALSPLFAALLLGGAFVTIAETQPKLPAGTTKVPVVFSGGHETDPRDHGRPVILVASALGVAPEVFREAFSHVHPARGGEPEPAQVRQNKQALMSALGPYGITNDRLDTVSNYYRYRADRGELWRVEPAEAYALVEKGAVTSFVVTNPGSGYSSAPNVSIPGLKTGPIDVQLSFSQSFEKNGSIATISLTQPKAK